MQCVKKFLLPVILSVILLFTSCRAHDPATGDESKNRFCIPDTLLKNITSDTLKAEFVSSDLTLAGKITFNEENVSKVYPLLSGHVTDVKVSLGDYVEKGSVLAVLSSSEMANYFNEMRSSQSELNIAKKNMEVTNEMRNSGVSSDKDFLIAQSEYQKAFAQLSKTKEILKIYGNSMSPADSSNSGYVIRAPRSGFIVEKNITLGEDIRPDDNSSLFTIGDLKEVWAVANVFETDIAKIHAGSQAEITTLSYSDKSFSGVINRISNTLDPETKVMNVKIGIKNPDFILKPGMFATIKIHTPTNIQMLTVKSGAIIFDDNLNFVLRFRGKCDVTIQPVTVFKTLNGKCFIKSDSLHEGDITVLKNGLFIYTALKKL